MSSWIDVVNGECSWIKIYYGVLVKVINERNYKNVIEIGVAYGGHAQDILSNSQCNYTGIDPYEAGYDPKDFFVKDVHRIMGGSNQQSSMNILHQRVLDRLSPFGDRCKIIKKHSWSAALLLDDDSYDLVFIDGSHLYDAVYSDISLYWPKIKKGGMMAGDDYAWADVKRAVHDFARENNLAVNRLTDNYGKPGHWFFEKK